MRPTLLTALLCAAGAVPLPAQSAPVPGEVIFYVTGHPAGLTSFAANADRIHIVGPQSFSVEADGIVWGEVDPRLLAIAAEHGVRVMPLIHNPGFDQESIHGLLDDPDARARTIAAMIRLGREHGFWGWQFDFENFHVRYRDRFTAFYQEAAAALHATGMTISVAVVPDDGLPGATPFHRYMRANWRGAFDLAALAESGDFLSFMTYAQHGSVTTPGPVAGLPWMRRMLEHALAEGVPPDRLSLGIPAYSAHWAAGYDRSRGAGVRGREVHFTDATALLDRSGTTAAWLAEQGAHYAFWSRAGTFEWLFLEDARAFRAKLGLLRDYRGLRGISVWVLGAEDPDLWALLPPVTRRR